MSTILTEGDLAELLNILDDAKVIWDTIATQLKLRGGEIQAIRRDEHDVGHCLNKSILVWLRKMDPPPTKERLVEALMSPSVGREDLAEKILPNHAQSSCRYEAVKHFGMHTGSSHHYVFCILRALFMGLLLYGYEYGYQNKSSFSPGRSFGLPVLKQKLIGREEEMKIIMDYFNLAEVDVVNLFGQAGFGKSEIAKHVGRRMIERGIDVYFIFVEEYTDVKQLKQTLISYTNVMMVEKWAEGLNRLTLLILDNVDGPVWIRLESRQQFQTDFLDVLVSHSSSLKILITSQQKIGPEFEHRFRSHRLHSLSTMSCTGLINASVDEVEIAQLQSETICDLVGNVPLAIKVLAPILVSSVDDPVRYVIKRLSEISSKLSFIASSANFTGKDRILNAIKLAFQFVTPQCQLISLLMAKFPGPFLHKTISLVITHDMMEQLNYKHFHVEDCLYELQSTSFLEHTSVPISFIEYTLGNNDSSILHTTLDGLKNDYLKDNKTQISYNFHVLIKDYLKDFSSMRILPKLLDIFWQNLITWLGHDSPQPFTQHIINDLLGIIDQSGSYSSSLIASIASNSFYVEELSKAHSWQSEIILSKAESVLVSTCKVPANFSFHYIRTKHLLRAYIITFRQKICDTSALLEDCMDSLIKCQPIIEYLHSLVKDDLDPRLRNDMYSHNNLITNMCLETSSCHSICRDTFRYMSRCEAGDSPT